MKMPKFPKPPKVAMPPSQDPIKNLRTDYSLIPHRSPLRRKAQKAVYGGILSPYVKLTTPK
jgi:hypothetical protein